MTNEQIRIAVAEECGWKRATHAKGWNTPNGTYIGESLPNYPESLDACAEFEKGLTATELVEYNSNLKLIINRDRVKRGLGTHPLAAYDFEWHATPLQRCEAFLRLKGKWKD